MADLDNFAIASYIYNDRRTSEEIPSLLSPVSMTTDLTYPYSPLGESPVPSLVEPPTPQFEDPDTSIYYDDELEPEPEVEVTPGPDTEEEDEEEEKPAQQKRGTKRGGHPTNAKPPRGRKRHEIDEAWSHNSTEIYGHMRGPVGMSDILKAIQPLTHAMNVMSETMAAQQLQIAQLIALQKNKSDDADEFKKLIDASIKSSANSVVSCMDSITRLEDELELEKETREGWCESSEAVNECLGMLCGALKRVSSGGERVDSISNSNYSLVVVCAFLNYYLEQVALCKDEKESTFGGMLWVKRNVSHLKQASNWYLWKGVKYAMVLNVEMVRYLLWKRFNYPLNVSAITRAFTSVHPMIKSVAQKPGRDDWYPTITKSGTPAQLLYFPKPVFTKIVSDVAETYRPHLTSYLSADWSVFFEEDGLSKGRVKCVLDAEKWRYKKDLDIPQVGGAIDEDGFVEKF